MPWTTPKTNWTSNESYNFSDINRVESNTLEVKQVLESFGYTVPTLTAITNRTVTSYDDTTSINRLESNLNKLRVAFITPPNWQETVTWTPSTPFTHLQANRWDQSLLDLYTFANQVGEGRRFCGTFIAGQEALP